MKLTAQSGSLCSQTRKTGWLSVPWNPTGTRNSKNWKKQNRIMPSTLPKRPGFLPKKEEQDILDLAQKIPEIWNAPTSTPKEKKRIIRILIDDITVLAEKRLF